MTISLTCPSCSKRYQVRDELAGKRAKCTCGQSVDIPQIATMQDLFDEEFPGLSGAQAESPLDAMSASAAPGELSGQVLRAPSGKRPKKSNLSPVMLIGAAGVLVGFVLIALLVFLPRGPGDGDVSGDYRAALGYDTPGQAFEAQKQAMIAQDWKRMLSVFTPEAQQSVIGSAATVATFLARNDPEVANLLRRHGIDESMWNVPSSDVNPKDFVGLAKRMQQNQEALVAALEDKHAFYAEMMKHTQRAGERLRERLGNSGKLDQVRAEAETAQRQAELIDVQINGDTATGRQSLSFGGKSVNLPVHFKRIDGRWYVHILRPDQT